jgi:outer membrane protein OmpA-like peptidoglycan-associated protein
MRRSRIAATRSPIEGGIDMTRSLLLAGAAALALFSGLPAAIAQSDPAALQLIERLRPQAGGQTRGIRVPGASDAGQQPTAPSQSSPVSAGPGAPVASPPSTTSSSRPTQAVARPPVRETTSDAPSASITVTFPSGSAALTPEAERALAPLGRALSSQELAGFRFRIEGHTDSVGDNASNQALSERRAAAVRDFLIQRFGVSASRVEAVGLGETQLLVPTPDETSNARNRRVQVVNIGS